MSKKSGASKQPVSSKNLISRSKNIPENDITNTSKNLSQTQSSSTKAIKPRLSRTSQKAEESQSAANNNPPVHETGNKKLIKSSTTSSHDTNQTRNTKLTNKNQPSFNSTNNEEQPAVNNLLRPSFRAHESSNDVSTTDNQNLLLSPIDQVTNPIEMSAEVTKDDENQQVLHQQATSSRACKPDSITPTVKKLKLDISNLRHPSCQFRTDKTWLDPQYHETKGLSIKKPNEIENEIDEPPLDLIDDEILDRIQGSMIGMALGDALGAHVEFRPRQYMVQHPVTDLEGGGTWGLQKGQFTDDTSMALCLANSLVARRDFVPYDQLVRYKWWYRLGYMSSTGQCFDIGAATQQSIVEFERRQKEFVREFGIKPEDMDYLSDPEALKCFNAYCSEVEVAGNGALMRLAPVPLFFYKHPVEAVEFSGYSGQITHGDRKAYDACRYYGALIVAALHGYKKEELLNKQFYSKHKQWFSGKALCTEIKLIAEGSYQKKGGYKDGIRGKGYIVNALEAALWAFWSDGGSFETGALAAVNLGDDTDTTAAIYGQLAGAYYGYRQLPEHWLKHVYAKTFMKKLSKWIVYEGERWQTQVSDRITAHLSSKLQSGETIVNPSEKKPDFAIHSSETRAAGNSANSTRKDAAKKPENKRQKETPSDTSPKSSTKNRISLSTATASLVPNVQNSSSQLPSQMTPADIGVDSSVNQQSSNELSSQHTNVPDSSIPTKPNIDKQSASAVPASILIPRTLDFDRCLEWNCDDVCEWVKSLGEISATYVDGFKCRNVTGYDLLNHVEDAQLIEYGVTGASSREKLIDSIKKLKTRCEMKMAPKNASYNDLDSEFNGDYVLSLHLSDITNSNTVLYTLKPAEDVNHSKLYTQIVEWLGPLPSDTGIDQIELIHSADLYQMFLQQIKLTESRKTEQDFQPHLKGEKNQTERRKVLNRLQSLTQQVHHNRSVPVVRVWHGCSCTTLPKLLSNGFAALSTLDNGWFGRAMYFTSSAEYAAKYTTSNGCLIMCYVVLRNPFPVITNDASAGVSSRDFRFYGRGNHSNYQCHYIPVAPVDENTPWDFRPPPGGVQDALYDELAVFQQADILPQAVVHLKPRSTSSSSVVSVETSERKFLSKE